MLKRFFVPTVFPVFFLIFLFFLQNDITKELGKMFNRNFDDVPVIILILFYLDICFSKYHSNMDTFQFRTCCNWCRHQMVFRIDHRLIAQAIQVGDDAIIRSCMSFNYHAPVTSWSGSWLTCFKRDEMTVWTESQILSLCTMERDESYLNTSAAVQFLQFEIEE